MKASAPWEDAPFKPTARWLMQLDQAGRSGASALAAGALWHAAALRNMIMAKPRTQLLEALGEAIYGFAVSHPDRAGSRRRIHHRRKPELLMEAISRDGRRRLPRCLGRGAAGAGRRRLVPAETAGRCAAAPKPLHRVHGLVIIACIRDELLTGEGAP